MKTIPEILQQAFDDIKNNHGVAVQSVEFSMIKQADGEVHCVGVQFEATRANKARPNAAQAPGDNV